MLPKIRNSTCDVADSLNETHDREREKTDHANEGDKKENEVRDLERVIRRSNDEGKSLQGNPKQQPACYGAKKIEPKLMNLSGNRMLLRRRP